LQRFTPKQIEKYQRQKYIAHLEKIAKNLFRMFRQEELKVEQFCSRFDELIKEQSQLQSIRLDSEYLQELQNHISLLHMQCRDINQEYLDNIKSPQMSNLNRLQKLKKRVSYKKDKHRNKTRDEDWG